MDEIMQTEIEMSGTKHYIRLSGNKIVKGFSDAFESPETGDICITENGGRHFELDGVINAPLFNDSMIPLYKWDGNEIVARSEAEIQADIDALPPHPISDKQRIEELEDAILELSGLI
jgi:hypothetical protein